MTPTDIININLPFKSHNTTQSTLKMPGEVIDRPNPQPLDSLIPESVLELAVKLQKINLNDEDLKGLEEFRRASNYIAVAMIFLSDNAMMERDLTHDDIKPR